MRLYVEAYGCTQSLGEAHALEAAARRHGHEIVGEARAAEVGLLVTCGVIGATEERMVRRWRALARAVPRVVVTGCLVPLRTERWEGPELERTTFLPIPEQGRFPELLQGWAGGTRGRTHEVRGSPEGEPSRVTAEVILAQGCTSSCSYCYSRLARGRLQSVPRAQLLAAVSGAVASGSREIRLSSLDTASWGLDRPGGDRLPALLRSIGQLPGSFRVRVGMMSPQRLRPIAAPLFDELARDPFYRFLHLPVQSGSDRVLEAMRRGYRAGQFLSAVKKARERVPGLSLATDVIVGFPTEEAGDFEATLHLLEEVEPEVVNVTRFSPRPGTAAARWPPLRAGLVKDRSRELSELRRRTARRRLERWVGAEEMEVLVTEHGVAGSSMGRAPNYLPVVLPYRVPLGRRVVTRIDGARSTYLLGGPAGRVIEEGEGPAPMAMVRSA